MATGGQLVGTDCKAENPMERAVRKVDEQLKMLNDEVDRLSGRLNVVSSEKPATPSCDGPRKPENFAPLVEYVNLTADKIAGVRGRILTMLERLDI